MWCEDEKLQDSQAASVSLDPITDADHVSVVLFLHEPLSQREIGWSVTMYRLRESWGVVERDKVEDRQDPISENKCSS